MILKVKKLHPEARLPKYATPGDAGMDLFALGTFTFAPGTSKTIATGIAVEIPEGYVGLIWDKSGLGSIGLKVMGGVIDSSYRGEIKVRLMHTGTAYHEFNTGDKVAQMLIQPLICADIVESSMLSESKRGSKGFGSTGK